MVEPPDVVRAIDAAISIAGAAAVGPATPAGRRRRQARSFGYEDWPSR